MLTVSLVGYGYWGQNVAKNLYKNDKINFKYICDIREERLLSAKALYANAVQYTTSLEDVLTDKDTDAVCVVVETGRHFEIAEKVIKAGKHLYIEKPFTDNVKQAIALKKEAEKNGVKIHVDHLMIFHPGIIKIKEMVDQGELGDILYFDCSRMNLGMLRNDVSAMWDLSVHDLSVIDYLSNGQEAKSVQCTGRAIYSSTPSVTFMTVDYGSFIANIKASWVFPFRERKMIISGTKKMLVYDNVDALNNLIVYDRGFDRVGADDPKEPFALNFQQRDRGACIPHLDAGDALFNSIEHFRQCAENGKESVSGPDAAIRVLSILEAADRNMITALKTHTR